ncbi:hypothetical protein Rhe02_52380 [Rhizocola hellebori]|uniref:Nudix hydrolase domain-containing protein n=1 Tax=Rhizocola hellebori TaxID=1392758 RepID=A0A8J3QAV9_9ACTN|nr:NUDIX hydrolase [Rhizocola hellebori]GIH07171.1 hypothetical protein Rhe02_52380 [Rhizocola hellebori]
MTWVEPEQWYAQLASFYAAAAALITDHDGNVLLVKPNYRNHWVIPGGYVDQNENPQEALARELHEELSLAVNPGHLLLIDWASPAGQRPRAIISFLFDCGQATAGDLTINTDELETVGFYEPERCRQLLPPSIAPRVDAALEARAKGTTLYLTDASAPYETN